MRKKLLKVIAISSLMLTAGGVMALSQMDNRNDIQMANAADSSVQGKYSLDTISENGFKKVIDFSKHQGLVTVAGKNAETTENGIIYVGSSSKTVATKDGGISFNNNCGLYIELPNNAKGTISISMYSSSNKRYFFNVKNDAQKLWSKHGSDLTNTGPQSFDFTSSDLDTTKTSGKSYLHLENIASGEMKVASFTITLAKDVTENFNGSVKQHFTVSYYDKVVDEVTGTETLEEYTSIKVNDILEGTATTKPSYVPEKVGFAFANWVDETGAVYDFNTPVTSNLSLYASWTEIATLNVTFDYGFGNPSVVEVNPNDTVSEPEMPVHPDGYAFVEWQLGGVKYDFTKPVTESITLVANWATPIYSESVQIDQSDINWAKADLDTPKQLTATVDTKGDTVNTHPGVTWSSSDTNVVTVDSTGKISTVGNKGESTITAKIYEGTSHEQSSSIVVTVGYSKLDTDLSENLYFDCVKESEANYPDATGKESAIVDLDGQTFGGFTIHSMSEGNDTKWSGNGSNKGRSLMTNADISFVAKKKGTLTFEFATTKDSRTIILDGKTYAMDAKDQYKTVVVENVAPGEHTLQLGLSQNSSDNKIWFKYLKFEETKNTTWVDTTVHLGYQVGKMNKASTANDSVKFIGFVAKEALDYLKDTWFEITIDDGTSQKNMTTGKKTTVYSSIGYYDAAGTLKEFTPTIGVTADYYYFAVTISNIPSTFKGTISAKAFVEDTTLATYASAASAVAEF